MESYWYLYFICFWLLFIIPAITRKKQRRVIKKSRTRRKKRGQNTMSYELIKKFIGKKCLLHGQSDFAVPTGVILSVEDNWVEVELENKTTKLINLDYIVEIEEFPEKKKK